MFSKKLQNQDSNDDLDVVESVHEVFEVQQPGRVSTSSFEEQEAIEEIKIIGDENGGSRTEERKSETWHFMQTDQPQHQHHQQQVRGHSSTTYYTTTTTTNVHGVPHHIEN